MIKPTCSNTIFSDPVSTAYSAPLPLKPAKLRDLVKLSKLLPADKRAFYDQLQQAQPSVQAQSTVSVDSDKGMYLDKLRNRQISITSKIS